MSDEEKTWIQTYTGLQFQPLNPRVEDIRIEDIAHALSNQCRFSGHCREFYSVADHSLWVSRVVEAPPDGCLSDRRGENRALALWGLLHDAPEAYLVDLPRPIKHGSEIGRMYREFEGRLMAAICERFGLPAEEPDEVKHADKRLLFTEQRDLMGRPPKAWKDPAKPLFYYIRPLSAGAAEAMFLERFRELTGALT